MKKIKRAVILIFVLVAFVFAAVAFFGCNKGNSGGNGGSGTGTHEPVNNNPNDNLVFVEQSDGTYGVKTTNKNIEGALVIPSTHNNKEVTIVLEKGFSDCRKLTSVVLSDGIKTIEKEAFRYCYGLNAVTIYPSLKEIGLFAFYDSHFDLIHIGTRVDFNYAAANGNAWGSPTTDYVNFIYSEE
ncbi:MAG: leucine-rich repeat domain-containing protein [Clostridiales bacterium]|nr:leucine-rich repeat domain-containing protein [Clostridiales bacterium]